MQAIVNSTPKPSLVFPKNLGNYPFWMTLAFYKYQRPNVGAPSDRANLSVTNSKNPNFIKNQGEVIRLPLPNQMVDSQDVLYSEEEAGLAAGMAINAFQSAGGGGAGAFAGVAAGVAAGALGVDRLLNNKAVNTAAQLVGVTVNPFLTVMFKSPKFKRHTLSWRLSPTNVEESQSLGDIVKAFKYNQLPSMTGSVGGSLLTYPNIVQITVSNTNGTFPYRFKPAVVENLSINFTPAGQPSFFGQTKAPTEIELRLTLLEIEYYLQDDFGAPNTTGLSLSSMGEAGDWLQTGINKVKDIAKATAAFF